MIGFNHLGHLGRLGNQMFEFAALRGIAAKHGYEVCIPDPSHKGIENYSLHDCFDLNHIPIGFIHHYLSEGPQFHFNEEVFNECPDNISLHGFFQTEKYFSHIRNTILKDFTFHKHIKIPCLEMMEEVEEPIFLHVRRGDANLTDPRGFKWSYTQCGDMHPTQDIEYYEKALSYFDKDRPVIIFSDSPEWVREQSLFSGSRFLHSEPSEKYPDGSYIPYTDLCLMSLCSGAIIANSSLSWWGAWLQTNPDKKIIAPKKWFGPAKNCNTKDLYCDGWKVI
jgi:hypothetical protein